MLAAIIPVKRLGQAKSRLANILSPAERRLLVQAMLDDVLAAMLATRGVDRVGVISADPAVLAQAAARGAEVILDQQADLNAALTQAAGHYAA
ncbi:MAG TPA: 2-phospho-L-lactate guanylyltransferase, partial [Kouleothrix sp.]|nr:2-phospho-L-lactate guanylyltransferase [Kouleothrix sp.]